MEPPLAKIVNGFQSLTLFAKNHFQTVHKESLEDMLHSFYLLFITLFFSSCDYSSCMYVFTLVTCNGPLKIRKSRDITDLK